MWSSAVEHFGDMLAPEQPPVAGHFNASACIQLLGVLPRSEGDLRASALARLRTFMAEDEGTAVPMPTVPRASLHRRRRPRTPAPPDSASESGSSESGSAYQ